MWHVVCTCGQAEGESLGRASSCVTPAMTLGFPSSASIAVIKLFRRLQVWGQNKCLEIVLLRK